MAHSPHRRWKGCCLMCGAHTLCGQGRSRKDPFALLRKLGRKRRVTRGYVPDEE